VGYTTHTEEKPELHCSKAEIPQESCAGHLEYPFQNQEINSHEEDSIATTLMREYKGKE
jgi:hypothetical protein